jgi:lipoate synthase
MLSVGTATFLIMGNICTELSVLKWVAADRRKSKKLKLQAGKAARQLDLRFIVITLIHWIIWPTAARSIFGCLEEVRKEMPAKAVWRISSRIIGKPAGLDMIIEAGRMSSTTT